MTNKLGKMNKLINKLSDDKFEFGKNDCYTFVAKLVKEWHGIDHIKLHAVYKNEKEAIKYMEKFGGIEVLTVGTLGYSCPPTNCNDGDVVSAEVGDGIALGFVFKGYGIFKGKTKVLKLSLSKCRRGWRIN